jgi:hypothetical protein
MSHNILIGDNAGYHSSTNRNINIGANCGFYNITGSDCVHIGSFAGEYSKNTSDNIFIGKNSGKILTYGNDNVFIGSNVGSSVHEGNLNVWIGGNHPTDTHNSLSIGNFIDGNVNDLNIHRNLAVYGNVITDDDMTCYDMSCQNLTTTANVTAHTLDCHRLGVTLGVTTSTCNVSDTLNATTINGHVVSCNVINSGDLTSYQITGNLLNTQTLVSGVADINELKTSYVTYKDGTLESFVASINPNESGQSVILFSKNPVIISHYIHIKPNVYSVTNVNDSVTIVHADEILITRDAKNTLFMTNENMVIDMSQIIHFVLQTANNYTIVMKIYNDANVLIDTLYGYSNYKNVNTFTTVNLINNVTYMFTLRAYYFDLTNVPLYYYANLKEPIPDNLLIGSLFLIP